jgi:hypothetical protein
MPLVARSTRSSNTGNATIPEEKGKLNPLVDDGAAHK